jgi:ligand-binding SRPBCC domain-containing protein
MAHISFEIELPFPVEDVFEYRTTEGALERLTPDWQKVSLVHYEGDIPENGTATFLIREKWLPPVKWKSAFSNYEKNKCYTETLVKGPFKKWVHTRHFESLGKNKCKMKDEIEFVLPFGKLGALLGEKEVRKNLEALFAFRYNAIAAMDKLAKS